MAAVVDSKICLRKFVAYLETYRGRDKIIRLLNYSLYIVSGLLKRASGSENALNAGKLAAELSNLRVMLRLLDDLAMLQFTLSYGTGSSSVSTLKIQENRALKCLYVYSHFLSWLHDFSQKRLHFLQNGLQSNYFNLRCHPEAEVSCY